MEQQILNHITLKIATTGQERNLAIDLLQQHSLPTSDLADDDKLLYLLVENDKILGTAGLELFENCALLRSVSVAKGEQRKGYGKIITTEIEKYAMESGIECMYLLTTTAKRFFDTLGYCVIERDAAPAPVKQSAEYSSLCPSSAVLMKKRI